MDANKFYDFQWTNIEFDKLPNEMLYTTEWVQIVWWRVWKKRLRYTLHCHTNIIHDYEFRRKTLKTIEQVVFTPIRVEFRNVNVQMCTIRTKKVHWKPRVKASWWFLIANYFTVLSDVLSHQIATNMQKVQANVQMISNCTIYLQFIRNTPGNRQMLKSKVHRHTRIVTPHERLARSLAEMKSIAWLLAHC